MAGPVLARLAGIAPAAALAALLLACAAPSLLAQSTTSSGSSCVQDEVILDANADSLVTVGDAVLAPPQLVGKVDGGHPLLNHGLQAFPGDVAYLDADANGSPSFRDIALFDRGSDGRGQGDILLGNTTWDNRTYLAGHIVRASDPLPAANVYAYSGLAYFDESGDGRRQTEEGIYGSVGGTLSAGDVRVSVDEWPPGSFVRASDPLVGQPLVTGPVVAFIDEDGSGEFNIASCPTPTPFSTSSSTSPTLSSSTMDLTPVPPSSSSSSPGTSADSASSSGKPLIPGPAPWLAAAGVAVAALVRRRLP